MLFPHTLKVPCIVTRYGLPFWSVSLLGMAAPLRVSSHSASSCCAQAEVAARTNNPIQRVPRREILFMLSLQGSRTELRTRRECLRKPRLCKQKAPQQPARLASEQGLRRHAEGALACQEEETQGG